MRPPVSDAELAELKSKLQAGESALDTASGKLEGLRKQVDQQERDLTQSSAELKKKQEQLDAELAETKNEKARRFAAEQSAQELSVKEALLTEQCAKLEAKVKEEEKLAAERTTRLTSVEADLEKGTRRIQELTEQAARLSSESEEHKRSAQQETRLRTALETQLTLDQERIRQLTTQIAELQNERLQLEIKLQEERGLAAKGMELLLAAQEKLSSVFKALNPEVQNGHHAPAEKAQASPEVKPESQKAEATPAAG
jgi:chromosome segregation ATPase